MIRCLRGRGFPDGFISWMQNYCKFFDEQQTVKICSKFSQNIQALKGVPQGSVLAPPRFCAFVTSVTLFSAHAIAIKYANSRKPSRGTRPRSEVRGDAKALRWCVLGLMNGRPVRVALDSREEERSQAARSEVMQDQKIRDTENGIVILGTIYPKSMTNCDDEKMDVRLERRSDFKRADTH